VVWKRVGGGVGVVVWEGRGVCGGGGVWFFVVE